MTSPPAAPLVFTRNVHGWLQAVSDVNLPDPHQPCSSADCVSPSCGDACEGYPEEDE